MTKEKEKVIEFLMEEDENQNETLEESSEAERSVASLLDKLGALLMAEKMVLAFDDDNTLIGVCIGTRHFVDNAAEGVEDLFDLVEVEPGGDIVN